MAKNLRKSGARAAGQLKRDVGIAKAAPAAGKKNKKSGALLERPWPTPQFAELPKDERDIVLERIEKEIAQPLTTVASTNSPEDSTNATTKLPQPRSALASFVVRGVNSVARLAARRELRVVVFATNPESLPFAHVPLLCRLHRVPVCVLHLSSKAFGRLFGLRSLSVLGIKRLPEQSSSSDDAAADDGGDLAAATLSDRERQQLDSIAEFLIAKASKKLASVS